MKQYTVMHDEEVNRFKVFEAGQMAYVQYEESDGVLDILHTIVPPQLEGRGIAGVLTEAAVEYASARKLKVRPTCSYTRLFFERHQQYRDRMAP